MPRENKTKFAVLGLLTYAPLSGYDIRRIYAESLGNFWSESYGHIYPILKRLMDEGLATREVQGQTGRPDRHVYTITDRGREELHRWLAQPAEPLKERVEVLLKVWHGWEMGRDVIVEHVKAFRAEHEALLRRYARYEEDLAQHDDAPAAYWLLTVGCGQHVSRAYIAWCDEALAKLAQLPAKPRAREEFWQPDVHRHHKETT